MHDQAFDSDLEMQRFWLTRLQRRKAARRKAVRNRTVPTVRDPRHFEVLCRIDAYADYVALVEADSAEEAAEMACDDHDSCTWEFQGVAEFDDRIYVTLDMNGAEIEETLVGDR